MVDNLHETLEKEKMSAAGEQRIVSLTAKIIQSMRNDSDFDLLQQTVSEETG